MPECILKSGSAIKVGRLFILRYDSSRTRFNSQENPPESVSDVIRQCRESIDINAQRILRRYMLSKHEPLEPASYDHHPMIVPEAEAKGFLGMLLEAAEHYDRFISLAEAAWISGAIDRKERSDIMRHWEGRLLNTADRCAKMIGRALEGSESDANSPASQTEIEESGRSAA